MAFNPPPRSKVYAAASGSTLQIDNGVTLAVLSATGLLATLTVTLPAQPYDGQPLSIVAPKGVTLITVNAPTGYTLAGTATTAAAANSAMRFKYCQAMTTWYPN